MKLSEQMLLVVREVERIESEHELVQRAIAQLVKLFPRVPKKRPMPRGRIIRNFLQSEGVEVQPKPKPTLNKKPKPKKRKLTPKLRAHIRNLRDRKWRRAHGLPVKKK